MKIIKTFSPPNARARKTYNTPVRKYEHATEYCVHGRKQSFAFRFRQIRRPLYAPSQVHTRKHDLSALEIRSTAAVRTDSTRSVLQSRVGRRVTTDRCSIRTMRAARGDGFSPRRSATRCTVTATEKSVRQLRGRPGGRRSESFARTRVTSATNAKIKARRRR
uniref:Uncharacterized protein n=1 Tax=Sipha flava TaxID=143950 RepID=A0A2S2R607_9HEMI